MIHPATGSVSAPIEEGVPFPWLFRGALAILLLALLIFQQAQVLTLALLLAPLLPGCTPFRLPLGLLAQCLLL